MERLYVKGNIKKSLISNSKMIKEFLCGGLVFAIAMTMIFFLLVKAESQEEVIPGSDGLLGEVVINSEANNEIMSIVAGGSMLSPLSQNSVVLDHWNYYATYDFDLLESNSRISAVRVVAHEDGTTVNVDTDIDGLPEYIFTLNEGDMWEMDLPTGTHIWSDKELTVHQYDDFLWDYKEVILPAVRIWDNDYYYGGIMSQGLGRDYILITAAYDNTYVAIDENNDGTPDLSNTLNEGQVWLYSISATTLASESLPGGATVGYDTRAGAHIYTTTDNAFTTPGGNVIQVHAYAEMSAYFGSAYNVLPTTSLGKEFLFPRVDTVVGPLYWDRADKMIFVATKPSTTVDIDKDCDGFTDATINLANEGDWDYWPHGSIDNAWSHGAYVSANEAIVAFYSSPGGGRYWDGFMSQMVPKMSARSDYWNSNGLYTNARWSTPYIHFFAYEDGTTLYRDTDNDGTADYTYNLNFCDGGQEIVASKEGEHFWVDDPDDHHVTMYQRLYYSASDTMSPISYQVNIIPVAIDIKPGSCPNPLNLKSKGVLPVAVLGTEDFDVTTIDPESIQLEGVSTLRWAYEDVATPFEGELCECHDLDGDGYLDLTLKFNSQEVVAALGTVNDGDVIKLTVTGNLREEEGGNPFSGQDCVVILLKKGGGKGRYRY